MWLYAEYAPTALYSLKLSTATSSGGKTLLAPTPYAVKMALLDAVYRVKGIAAAEGLWPVIRDLQVAFRPPSRAVVTNLFTKILKKNRGAPPEGSAHAGPLGKSIGYREYVHFAGPVGLAVSPQREDEPPDALLQLLATVNYLGKRGGFLQLVRAPEVCDALPAGFVILNQPGGQTAFAARGLIQVMDDCAPSMTLEKANIYSGKNVMQGRDRLSYPVVLPYRLVRASKSYTLYERTD